MSIKVPTLGRIRADGIGIGTDTPLARVHINGAAHPEVRVTSTDTEGGQISLFSTTGYWVLRSDGAKFHFYHNGNKVTILESGYFGIGTATPEGILHIDSNLPFIRFFDSGLADAEKITLRLGKSDVSNESVGIEFLYDVAGASTTSFHFFGDAFGSGLLLRKGGNVGIGTTTPGNPLAVNRSADGIIVDFESDDTVEGNVSIAGNTTSYNAFMGSHYTQLKDEQKTPPVGAIVAATGEIIPCESHIEIPDVKAKKIKGKSGTKVITKDVSGVERKEYFSYVELASKKADKRAYGVYHAKMSDDAKGQSFGEDDKAIHQIAALGLYKVRVTDTNGDIEVGDYIQSSIRVGEGERQDDDILHNYTVAKSNITVNWSEVTVDLELGYKWQLIPATLHSG